MNIKAILKNVKDKGLVETYKIAKRKYHDYDSSDVDTVAAELLALMDKGLKLLDEAESKSEKKAISKLLKEQEDMFKRTNPKAVKKYKNELKRRTLKDEIPALYAEESKKPVENKVIFMENGGSPSPTGYHLSKEIKKQGKYEVIYKGLHIRKVSDAEYYHNAIDYVRELATAKAVFFSTANDILSQFDVRPETKVIQLWHGVGIFKKVGHSTEDNLHFGKSKKDREEYDQYRNYTHVTVAGEGQIWVFEDAFHIDRSTGVYRPIGIARTDVFYWEDYYKEQLDLLYSEFPQAKGKKIILYAPTFRGSVANATAPDQLDIAAMAKSLSDEYVLLIKHHGLSQNRPEIPVEYKNSFAFDMNESKILTIEGLLRVADILITDYSSVAFEFAIRELPIVFFAYDLDDYNDKRGMYYDYDEITPGPVCKKTEEICDYINNLDERFDKEEILAFKKKFVSACDGHAIERTIALLEE